MDGCQGGKKIDSDVKSIKVELEHLVCKGSYDHLEIALSQVDGIMDLDLDRNLKALFVDFDPTKVSEDQIIGAISRVGCRIQEF